MIQQKCIHPTARPECFTEYNVVKCIEGCDKIKLLLYCILRYIFEDKNTQDERRENNKFYLIFLCFISFSLVAKKNEKEYTSFFWYASDKDPIKQLHIGNFALPSSQQPGPLVGFGQNIIDKGDLQIFLYGDQLKGKQRSFNEVAPSILYAITDYLSLFVEQSVAVKFREDLFTSHGIEDLIAQVEGTFYERDTLHTQSQITLVGNIGFPTGSALKIPPTGFGAVSFFLGFTAFCMKTDWYYFTAMAGVFPTSHKTTQFGKQFLYQFGLSKNIAYKADGWILNWMVELDGFYSQRNKILGCMDLNSGGNFILLGPSLWFSTQRFILQGGISAVIFDHSFKNQFKNSYFAAVDVGWKF
ncbi:MAG TPA: hypothetical protein VHX42_04375 [Candidatus Babeliales bacterium]|jgi:hypothetical protein|nr:hypothetical protein [Candidatus Babeliales bacterium]